MKIKLINNNNFKSINNFSNVTENKNIFKIDLIKLMIEII